MTYVVVWEFEPRPDAVPAFVHAYGPDGEWVPLFRRSPDCRHTLSMLNSRPPAGRGLETQ